MDGGGRIGGIIAGGAAGAGWRVSKDVTLRHEHQLLTVM
jgi:hypothetical protein